MTTPVLGQFNTTYNSGTIDFFEDEEHLEGYEQYRFKLIPKTDIFVNFNTGFGFANEKNNFNQIHDLIQAIKKNLNDNESDSKNHYVDFRNNQINPYRIGISLDAFIYDYFGIGFTYARNHYFSHKSSISRSKEYMEQFVTCF